MNEVDPGRLVALYAVDALEGAERFLFEQHLEACHECAVEVTGLQEITAQLSLLGTTEPPPELRPEIMASLTRRTESRVVTAHRSVARSLHAVRMRVLAAAAILIVAGGAAWAVTAITSHPRSTASSSLPSDLTTARGDIAGAPATVTYSRSAGGLILQIDDLPSPGDGATYQAWLMDPSGNATSEGVFTPDATEHGILRGTFTPSSAGSLAITVEQAGGSTRPSGRRYVIPLP